MAGSDTKKNEDILADAKKAFDLAREHEQRNRELALEDIRFARLGEQWPETVRRQRELDGRPCLTINRLPAFIRQVVNDARQNKPGINVHPVDSQADPQTADVFNGLIRQIEQSSDAEVAYDTALEFAVTCGFGYFKINTRYATDDTFDQDIVIERVANPFSIYGDPSSNAADSSDWMSAFELDQITKAAFKKRWKDAEATDFSSDTGSSAREDRDQDRVQIAAEWLREEVSKQIVAVSAPDPTAPPEQVTMAFQLGLSDRLIVDLEVFEQNAELFQALGMTIIGQPRDVPSFKVTQRILSGSDVLETLDWAGKYIPIVPVYGEEVNVEGIRHFRGLVRDAKDPQRMFNYWRTTTTELVALAPKAPFIGRKGAFETDLAKWATANTETHAFIEFDGPEPPQRQPFAGVPAGALQEANTAAEDIKSIVGIFNAPMGEDNEASGRAILARQKQADVGSFHFIDNLSRAVRHGGRIMLDLIPKVYSTQRIIRTLQADGKQQAVQIGAQQPQPQQTAQPSAPSNLPIGSNPPMPQPQAGMAMAPPTLPPDQMSELQQVEKVFDLTVGKYDLTVQAGPSYSSLREELNTVLIELVRAYPPAAPALMDLIVKTLDIPDAQEVVERLQQVQQAEQQGKQGQDPQQMQQFQAAMQQAQGKIADLSCKLQQAQQQVQAAGQDAELKSAELQLRAQELSLKQFEAETDRLQAETDAERARRESAQAVAPQPGYPSPMAPV